MHESLKKVAKTILGRNDEFMIPITKKVKIEKLGNNYAFCFVPQNYFNQKSIIYSVGTGEDILLETEMLKSIGCEIHLFDPTPRAIKHFKDLIDNTSNGKKMSIDQGENYYNVTLKDLEKLYFHPIGLWKEDTMVEFFMPPNPNFVSCSITNIQNSEQSIKVPVKTLSTLMNELKHNHVDFLKIDIEGAEYEVLDHMLKSPIPVNLIYVEFHAKTGSSPKDKKQLFVTYVQKMIGAGFDLIHVNNNQHFTFIKKL